MIEYLTEVGGQLGAYGIVVAAVAAGAAGMARLERVIARAEARR